MLDTYMFFGCLYAVIIIADDWGKFDKWTWFAAVFVFFTWPASFIYEHVTKRVDHD